ncbi:MAG: PHP domain-containing protein [Myxococcota bacterium]
MRVELHCHSTYSDGSVGAREVARRAADRNVEVFCLTDHDTIAGYDETVDEIASRCTVLRGLELTCVQNGRTIHLLMYGLDEGPALAVLCDRLAVLGQDRRDRIVAICDKLRGLGVTLDPAPILAGAVGRTAGRPDVARALVSAGVCKRPAEAFQRFLGDDGPAFVAVDRITLAEALALGRSVGARMSLAHPHTAGNHALVREMFVERKAEGLEGIEALYGRYARAQARGWLQLAEELDLVVTGGSDFHGDLMPEVSRPVIDLPEPHATRLRDWLRVA